MYGCMDVLDHLSKFRIVLPIQIFNKLYIGGSSFYVYPCFCNKIKTLQFARVICTYVATGFYSLMIMFILAKFTMCVMHAFYKKSPCSYYLNHIALFSN